jgi:O-methyltransferase
MKFVRNLLKAGLRRAGYEVIPFDPNLDYDDFDLRAEDAELGIMRRVGPYTMTSRSRIAALCRSIEFVIRHDIPGDIVECGVWKGGSMMAAALRLQQLGDQHRKIYLYDTFEGMTAPTDVDKDNRGRSAAARMQAEGTGGFWFRQPLEEVRRNLASTGFDAQRLVFVKGPVEQTIPHQIPDQIAILRLDTDWYESTKHELEHLYPRLSVGGSLILDDYGYWRGSRKAVDEYIEQHHLKLLLHRIDHSGRVCVKLE